MVAASAAFGNSFTLPAVFLTTLLPAPLADRALGYAALFLLAWSPCLWSIGMALVGGGSKQPGPAPRQQQVHGGNGSGGGSPGAAAVQQQEGLVASSSSGGAPRGPQPLAWRQPRVVDVTPSAVASSSSSSSSSSADEGGEPEPPTWAQQLAQHPALPRLGQFAAQVLNPPVLAILAGTLMGLTPAGRALLVATQPGGAAAAAAAGGSVAAALPPELGLLHAVVKAALEVRGCVWWGRVHSSCWLSLALT